LRAQAKQSILSLRGEMDCFVARAPRNDGKRNFAISRRDAPGVLQETLLLYGRATGLLK
jgi:hypothetical protein